MEFAAIIQDFAHSERVPVAAIRAATAEPDAFVEQARALMRRVHDGQQTADEERAMAVLVHVLAEIGDERALPELLDVLSQPREELDEMLGGAITESLPQVLMRLGANGAEGFQRLIENLGADQFVRAAAFDAWTYQVLAGRISREQAHAYLAGYPPRVNPPADDHGWVAWVDAVAALGFDDLREAVAKVFADNMISPGMFGFPATALKNFESVLAGVLANPDGWKRDPYLQPFADTVKELSGWHGYSEAFIRRKNAPPQPEIQASFQPAVNRYRGVGRNDPCPCGSGKKFKKCCLQTVN